MTQMTLPEFIRLFHGYLGRTDLVRDAYENAERFHKMLHGSRRYGSYNSFRSALGRWNEKRIKQAI